MRKCGGNTKNAFCDLSFFSSCLCEMHPLASIEYAVKCNFCRIIDSKSSPHPLLRLSVDASISESIEIHLQVFKSHGSRCQKFIKHESMSITVVLYDKSCDIIKYTNWLSPKIGAVCLPLLWRPCYVSNKQKGYLFNILMVLGQLTYFLCTKTIQFHRRIINSFLSWIDRFRGIDNLFQ